MSWPHKLWELWGCKGPPTRSRRGTWSYRHIQICLQADRSCQKALWSCSLSPGPGDCLLSCPHLPKPLAPSHPRPTSDEHEVFTISHSLLLVTIETLLTSLLFNSPTRITSSPCFLFKWNRSWQPNYSLVHLQFSFHHMFSKSRWCWLLNHFIPVVHNFVII